MRSNSCCLLTATLARIAMAMRLLRHGNLDALVLVNANQGFGVMVPLSSRVPPAGTVRRLACPPRLALALVQLDISVLLTTMLLLVLQLALARRMRRHVTQTHGFVAVVLVSCVIPCSFVRVQVCGAADLYCPEGSHLPTSVSEGYYTVGNAWDVTNRTRVDQACRGNFVCSTPRPA